MTERKAKTTASLEEKERHGSNKAKASKVTNHNQIVMKNSKSEQFKMNNDSRVPAQSKPESVNIGKESNKYGHTNGTTVEIRVENMDTNTPSTPDEKPQNRRHRRVSDVIDSIGSVDIGSRRRSTSLSESPYSPPLSPAKTGSRRGSIGISRTPTPPSTPASDTGYNSYGYSTPHSPSTISPEVPTRPLPPRRVVDMVDAAPMAQPTQQEPPDEPMSIAVAEATMPVEKDADEYNMNHSRRGHAVIFNHEKFNNQPDRGGSEVDVDNLCKLYSQLGFQVTTHHNKEYQEIRDIISDLANDDHSDADCLMVTVLTHGMTTGYIFASDMPYSVDHLWTPFTADKCLTLAGKPKIFIIQACRGEQLDPGVNLIRKRSRTETDSSGGSYKIPTHADFLIAYSSVEGFFSWRNPEMGTWYVQCLCQELLANGGNLDFLKILTRTARRVALDHESYNDVNPWQHQQKQVPAINSMLIRDIYFRPK